MISSFRQTTCRQIEKCSFFCFTTEDNRMTTSSVVIRRVQIEAPKSIIVRVSFVGSYALEGQTEQISIVIL